jgi:RNA polymerase sigma factor (TIGR02999 family)
LAHGAPAKREDFLGGSQVSSADVAGIVRMGNDPVPSASGDPLPPEDATLFAKWLYDELRAVAAAFLRREPRGHLLQPTALINEAYVRLAGAAGPQLADRAAFLAAAVRTFRRVLIDHARSERAQKRPDASRRLALDATELAGEARETDVLALNEALERLAALSPRQARVVELRFFAGLSEEAAADVIGVSRRTVQDDWRGARAWLRRELSRGGEDTGA